MKTDIFVRSLKQSEAGQRGLAFKRIVLKMTLVAMICQPLAVNAQVIAAGTTGTRVESAPNGVPLIQIAAPNGAGVSHNQYGQFNVGQQGVILNNSAHIANSQLAGYIDANTQLAGRPANLIVNEVTGTQASALNGFIEVAGQRADVVVANPNGISCDGCGFVNTARATLSTGMPIFGTGGSLDAFRVGSGQIVVSLGGFNGRSLDQLDLLARSVQIGGGLWAPSINVVAGANRVEHDSLAATPLAGSGPVPALAIDIALLGGMYADKIRLLATEAGVGVNSQGKLQAQNGNFQLDAAGRISLGGQIESRQRAIITGADDLDNQGSVFAERGVKVAVAGQLQNTGTLAAGSDLDLSARRIDSSGSLGAGLDADGAATQAGQLRATALEVLAATGKNLAGGDLLLSGGRLDLAGAQSLAQGRIALTATGGDLDLSRARLQSGGRLDIQADGAVINDAATLTAGGNFALQAGRLSNRGGQVYAADTAIRLAYDLDNTAGRIVGNGALTLSAFALDNRGGLLRAQGGSDARFDLQLGERLDNRAGGRLESTGDLRLQATDIDNGGSILSAGRLELDARRNIDNSAGNIEAGRLQVTAGQIVNRAGRMTSAATADIVATGSLDNAGGQILSNETFRLQAARIDNTGGRLESGSDIDLATGRLSNTGGRLIAGGDARIGLDSLAGGGSVSARDLSLSITGNDTHDASRQLIATRDLSLIVGGDFTNLGTLAAVRKLTLAAANIDNRAGAEILSKQLQLSTGKLSNAGAIVADTQSVQAGRIVNTGSFFGQDITLAARQLTNRDGGAIASGKTLNLYIDDTLENLDGALLYSAGNLVIAGADTRDADRRLSKPTNKLLNRSAQIEAQGDLELAVGQLDNQRSDIQSATRSLGRSVALYQDRDEAWSGSLVGNVYANGNVLETVLVTRTCDLQGNNCSERSTTQTASPGFFSSLFGLSGDLLGTVVTPPTQVCEGSTCRLVSSTTTTRVLNPYGAEHWHIDTGGAETFKLSNYGQGARRYAVVSEQQEDYVVSATPEAAILAGGQLRIKADSVNNVASRIEAGGDLDAEIGQLNNKGVQLNKRTRDTTWRGDCSDIKGDFAGHLGGCASGWIWTASVSDSIMGSNASLDAVMRGNRNLKITARSIDNRTVDAQSLIPGGINTPTGGSGSSPAPSDPAFTLPGSTLYQRHPEPSAHYLVETDPRFTQYANFISSDYMLSRLGLDIAATQKRLGDGFYEQQLVRSQLIAQRGNAAQGNYANLNAQYQALLEAGAAYAKAFSLVPGITLSQAQVAQLSQDMVWLESRVIDGQSVLVPVAYLAQGKATRETGGIIAAGNNATLVTGDLANIGGKIVAGQALAAVAVNDLSNDSGAISAQNIKLSAGKDLRIGTATQAVEPFAGQTFTHAGQAGSVAGQSVQLSAGRDIALAGAKVTADNASLSAGRDLVVGSQALNTEQHVTGQGSRGQSSYDRSAVDQRGSQVNVTGNLALSAERDLAVVGSRVEAGGSLAAVAGNTLAVVNARETESGRYSAHSNTVSDERQWQKDSGKASSIVAGQNLNLAADSVLVEGSRVQAGQDATLTAQSLALVATHDSETRQESYSNQGKRGGQQGNLALQSDTATGSIVTAGNQLNLQSTGNATVGGSALAAEQHLAIDVAGNLSLTAAQSSRQAEIQRSNINSRKATALSFSQSEIRQLLATLSAGSAEIKVGGDFTAATPETRSDGTLNADRMTANGIVKGDSRQQVSVTRTGDGADANPQNSQVFGNLAAQGNRNHSNESFAPTAANAPQTGQAALRQYLNSGLIQIASDPQVADQLKAQLKPDGSTLTYKDDAGKLSLTVAGQAKAQAIYNTLRLTETFDRKKFANQQTAQIVTLAAAIALTAMTGGAGAGTLGAALTTAGATSAAMINAAVIGMASTMVGQLAGGASFDQAFEAGVKAGATSALLAGVAYGVSDSLGLNVQYDAAGNVLRDTQGNVLYQTAYGAEYAKMSALDKLGTGTWWTQTAANSTAYGAAAQLNGGSFKQGMTGGLIGALGSTLNSAVGDWASQNGVANGEISKMAMHAGIGALQAKATKQDALAGAIGGATAEALAPVGDQLDAATGNKAASELTTAAASIAANHLLNKNAETSDLTAAYQGLQTDRSNRQLHPDQIKTIKKIAGNDAGKAEALSAVLCYAQNCNIDGLDGKSRDTGSQALYDEGAVLAKNDPVRYSQLMQQVSGAGLLSGNFAYGLVAYAKDKVGNATNGYLNSPQFVDAMELFNATATIQEGVSPVTGLASVARNGLVSGVKGGAALEPVVTAKGTVSGAIFEDVNQAAKIGATNEPTLIADRIAAKVEAQGKPFPNGTVADSHAEIGVIQQAYNAGKTQGAEMSMTVFGKDVCGYCKGDIAAAADAAGLTSLTVQAMDNVTGLPKTYYWQHGMKSIKEKP